MKPIKTWKKAGLNPAKVFRRHRLKSDFTEMQRYVMGFYEYEFAPNYNPRKRNAGLWARESKPEIQKTPSPSASIQLERESDADFIISLLKKVEKLLEQIETRGSSRDMAGCINELEKKGEIPRQISFRMHSIRLSRNRVVHDRYVLSQTEREALEADWAIIEEWWKNRRQK